MITGWLEVNRRCTLIEAAGWQWVVGSANTSPPPTSHYDNEDAWHLHCRIRKSCSNASAATTSDSTPSTAAPGGPSHSQSIIRLTESSAPCAQTSTVPCAVLRTHPYKLSDRARLLADWRKPMPCTRPLTTACTAFTDESITFGPNHVWAQSRLTLGAIEGGASSHHHSLDWRTAPPAGLPFSAVDTQSLEVVACSAVGQQVGQVI